MKVAQGRHLSNAAIKPNQDSRRHPDDAAQALLRANAVQPPHTGLRLRLRQLSAMLRKRALFSLRSRTGVITQLLLPLLFAIAAIAIARYGEADDVNAPRLFLDLSAYGSTTVRGGFDDSTGDIWSGVNPMGEAYLANLASTPPAGPRVASLFDELQSSLSDDPRLEAAGFSDVSGDSLARTILAEAEDYSKTKFYSKNIAAFSFERGAYYVRPNAAGTACELWTGQAFEDATSASLNLAINDVYRLAAIANAASAADPLLQLDTGGSPELPTMFTNDGRDLDAGSTFFLDMQGGATRGALLALNDSNFAVNDEMQLYCESSASLVPVNITVVASAAQASDPGTAQIVAYHSERALHAAPQALNLASNVMARHYLGSDARLYAYNHPLPATQEDALDSILQDSTGFQVALFLIFATGFLMASFALFPVGERVNKAKHIQFVSGVNAPIYWLGNYMWDLLMLLPAAVGVVIVFALFDVAAYHQDRLGVVFVYFMLFGWAAIPLIYNMQLAFKTPAGAYASLSILFILGGIAALLAVWITDVIGEDSVSNILRYVLELTGRVCVCQNKCGHSNQVPEPSRVAD